MKAIVSARMLALSIAIAGTIAGCSSEERLRNFCTDDTDCPPGFRCDRDTGLCLCATDDVCKPDEYCAPDGRCRKRMSCDTTLDCPEGTFCDTTTGNCIDLGKCTRDEQCPLGEICDNVQCLPEDVDCVTPSYRCIGKCRTSGDCPLGQVCRCPDGESACDSGHCQADGCDDNSFCDYGQFCDLEGDSCYDAEGPFCDLCQPVNISNPYRCGPGPNFCIMTNNDPSLEPFCGVDCSDGQECPNGYSCSLILTAPEGSCRSNDECESGECHINEGDDVGFCLCVSDAECPRDNCDDFASQCRWTRKPCTPGGTECNPHIYCIDGLCLLGRNCTPIEGLDCSDFGK